MESLKNQFAFKGSGEFKTPNLEFANLTAKVGSLQKMTKMIITKSTEIPNTLTNTLSQSGINLVGSTSGNNSNNNITVTDIYIKEGLNKNAGLEILQRLEKNMIGIHENNQKIIAQAEFVDRKLIPPAYTSIVQKCDTYHKMHTEASQSVPFIYNSIQNAKKDIATLVARVAQLESLLTTQVDEVTGLDTVIWKENVAKQTQKYRDQKSLALKNVETEYHIGMIKREQMQLEIQKLQIQQDLERQRIEARERERADRIREKELQLQLEQQHAAMRTKYSDEFNKQFAVYSSAFPSPSQLTAIGKAPSQTPVTPSLEQVVLEDDPKQLELFLAHSTAVQAAVESPRGTSTNSEIDNNNKDKQLQDKEASNNNVFKDEDEDDGVAPNRPEIVPDIEDPDTEDKKAQISSKTNPPSKGANNKKNNNKRGKNKNNNSNSNNNNSKPVIPTSSSVEPAKETDTSSSQPAEDKVEDIDESWLT